MKKRFIISLLVAFIFVSCKERTFREDNQFLHVGTDEIIAGIARKNILECGAVGISGTRTEQWDRYEALLTKASNIELLVNTNHKNPTVRCYAFTALVERENPHIFRILLNHLRDTARVRTFFGCITDLRSVGQYFLETARIVELSVEQKQIIDSTLLFDKRVILKEKYLVLNSLKPEAKYYDRIKEMALAEDDFRAVPSLAKYKNKEDIPIVMKLIRSNDSYKQHYGFLSVANNPQPVFFPELEQIIKSGTTFNAKHTFEQNAVRRALYSAIIQYKNLPARKLLEIELQNANGRDLLTKTDLIFQALKQYPDSI